MITISLVYTNLF